MDAQNTATPRHNLPPQPTSFIGRETEITEIIALLDDPACRLLTLVGAGGIGKTRLAIEVAKRKLDAFPNGVFFVPLQPLTSHENIVPTIAASLGYQFQMDNRDPRQQLIDYFRRKQALLVLDNFEHLLEGVGLLVELLSTASQVKLLVTSRESLNLREEWLRPVSGLHTPRMAETDRVDTFDAVRLFVERARRVRADFSLEVERNSVVRLCQQVEGMPLALELAASWVNVLRCVEIVEEMQRSLDFLAASLRDLPERHRSVLAVFEQSWRLLTPNDRDAFQKLSVFRGGFRREAAEQVAGASLKTLRALVNKSLVRVDSTGRYDMHELVRQYAEDRLGEDITEREISHQHHSEFYTEFLHECEAELKGPQQIKTLQRIDVEIDNIRAAWRHAVKHRVGQAVSHSLDSLGLYLQWRSRFEEGQAAFELARTSFENEPTVLLGRLLIWEDWFSRSIPSRAQSLQRAGISILRERQAYGAAALLPLWNLSHFDEDTALRQETRSFFQNCLEALEKQGDRWGAAWALIGLGVTAERDGDYEKFSQYLQLSYEIFAELGEYSGQSSALFGIARSAIVRQKYDEARRIFQEIADLNQLVGDPLGLAAALVGLGQIARYKGDYAEAKRHVEVAGNVMYETMGHNNFGWLLMEQALIAFAEGDYPQARRYLHGALTVALNGHNVSGFVEVFVALADLMRVEVDAAAAVEVLAATLPHCKMRFEYRRKVEVALAELETQLSPESFKAAYERGTLLDLETAAASVLKKLSAADPQSPLVAASDNSATGLIEPLTKREREVLCLVADGLTNREIADRLVIAVGTVKAHLNTIYGKLEVRNRVEAVSQARELQLL